MATLVTEICNQVCTKCKLCKPRTEFYESKSSKSGYFSWCKGCVSFQKKERYRKNPEKNRERRRQYYLRNRDTIRGRSKKWKLKNPNRASELFKQYNEKPENKKRRRNQTLMRMYKIDLVKYNELFIIQNGKCAICDRHQSELNKAMCVDHNHNNEEIRGLLCDRCNRGLGMFLDDIKFLKKAIEYMEK